MPTPRMTIPTQRVLRLLLEDPGTERFGAEIGAAAGLASGTVHPILARLETLDWLESRWEDIDPRAEGRPARRYYRLTETGRSHAHEAVARAYRPSQVSTAPLPRTGSTEVAW
jgi:PadR family transcriptional regulator, regulatory protein PadR